MIPTCGYCQKPADIRSLEARSKDLHAELDELREATVEVPRG